MATGEESTMRSGADRIKVIWCAVLGFALNAATANAGDEAVERRVPYQGKLTGVTGTATLVVELWDAPTGGARAWGPESQLVTPDANGNFAIVIGASGLDRCARQPNGSLACAGTGDGRADLDQIVPGALYVQVAVTQSSTTTTLTPRQQLFPSFHADVADTVLDGAVTTVKIGAGAVTTDRILDGAVTNEKIQDGTILPEKFAASSRPTVVSGGSGPFVIHQVRYGFFGGSPVQDVSSLDSNWISGITFDTGLSAWALNINGAFSGQFNPVCTAGMERGSGSVESVDVITTSPALIYLAPRGPRNSATNAPTPLPANNYSMYVTLICIGGKP